MATQTIERAGLVTARGNPITLLGPELAPVTTHPRCTSRRPIWRSRRSTISPIMANAPRC